ncbi:hypothetical protein AMATHDRAFT_137387 [Amanita thiersii Skay4041]|uniref:Uncharacterized protein n=1 Tax=Amanita thiersii Skay4041 TaxID=703135 RepID=A0A2A9NR50_9AGAR|nr:hypothetical protein AMATHDRAFT_137387 [Amanita thiersii Skay4041]
MYELDNTAQEYRIPPPPHRHAAPSAPWPWIDIHNDVDAMELNNPAEAVPGECDHEDCEGRCWKKYPESRFPNWTINQVRKSKIREAIDREAQNDCIIHQLDITQSGAFKAAQPFEMKIDRNTNDLWNEFKSNAPNPAVRTRALFVQNMSGVALQMLGGRYNIEPFFFSSALNWIPTRFQEDSKENVGDHITITLPFVQSVPAREVPTPEMRQEQNPSGDTLYSDETLGIRQMIDIQAPLRLENTSKALVLDLLSVHLIRNVNGNILISYHAERKELPTTTAPYLHTRVRYAGRSVYWQKMLSKTNDPTFLLLIFIWHAMYAWDEAFQDLYEHICHLETEVIDTSSMVITQELHIIRAHHLHYASLLAEFKKTIKFILDTPNPALNEHEKNTSKPLLERECHALLNEIKRMDVERLMQERRLKNVMNLVFSSVNIRDSKYMQKMTQAAVRDSAGDVIKMKQIAYLTMVFLPSSFVAAVFGMNVQEVSPSTHGTLRLYFGIAIGLTAFTVWIIVAFQSRYLFRDPRPFWKRLAWPFHIVQSVINKEEEETKYNEPDVLLPRGVQITHSSRTLPYSSRL